MKYDWKLNSDIGHGRSRITHEDGTPVANMDALVDVEDYPKTWFAERLVAAHNGELRAALAARSEITGAQECPEGF